MRSIARAIRPYSVYCKGLSTNLDGNDETTPRPHGSNHERAWFTSIRNYTSPPVSIHLNIGPFLADARKVLMSPLLLYWPIPKKIPPPRELCPTTCDLMVRDETRLTTPTDSSCAL